MHILKKQILCFLMALVMLWSAMPISSLPVCAEDVAIAAVTEDDLRATVDQQIRAFAKSLNQSNADEAAAKALAKHGLSGGGKKLSVGKTHALTATLWNSELMQVGLSNICVAAIEYMRTLDKASLPHIEAVLHWSGSESNYKAHAYITTNALYENMDTQLVLKTFFEKCVLKMKHIFTVFLWGFWRK